MDIHLGHILREPLRVVDRIYGFCGLELSAETRKRMSQWVENNRQGKHGTHDYTLDTFGLTEDDINAAFSFYVDNYGITREKK